MARPTTTDEVTVRTVALASFHVDEFTTDPGLLTVYGAFIAAVQDRGGEVTGSTYISVSRPKNPEELESALTSQQNTWDHCQKLYERWRGQGTSGMQPYEVNSAKRHAEAEGLDWLDDAPAETVDA